MTPTEKQLRELAERATGDAWYVDKHTKIDKWFAIYNHENRGIEICKFDYDDVDHEQVDINAQFIAAASPTTVIALLNKIDALDTALNEACNVLESSSDREHRVEAAKTLRLVGTKESE